MLSGFENKVADFIKAKCLLESADRILLAVSGGVDSTALLYAMYALRAEGVLSCDFVCAHINHQLRGAQADTDEDFVIAQARNLNLPVTTSRLDVRGFAQKNKLSIETAARKLRIESLLDIAKANNCSRIATAHQKNDNAETVLQRLARGTGFRGLGGIWPMRSFAGGIEFVRPLLCVTRAEIIEYLKERNLKWRTDKTNADCTYRRNFIRHRLIPVLQKQCSGFVVEQLFDLSQSAQRFYSLVCGRAEKTWQGLADCSGDKVVLDLKIFSGQPKPVKVELVRRSLTTIGCGERDLTHKHYERILQLSEQNISGGKIELPDGFVVWREYEGLNFARLQESFGSQEQVSKSICLKVPGQTRFGSYSVKATICEAEGTVRSQKSEVRNQKSEMRSLSSDLCPLSSDVVEWFDLDKVSLPLVVRLRKAGDRFVPLGLSGEKRVGKFLTAAKVPQEIRRNVLIVADSEKIIWVWPIRMSEQARITGGTRKVLQLQINEI